MYTYEDLIEAVNSNHENDHEKLIYIIYTLGRYFNMNVDNWITSLDEERERLAKYQLGKCAEIVEEFLHSKQLL